jgi:hypothetical protein
LSISAELSAINRRLIELSGSNLDVKSPEYNSIAQGIHREIVELASRNPRDFRQFLEVIPTGRVPENTLFELYEALFTERDKFQGLLLSELDRLLRLADQAGDPRGVLSGVKAFFFCVTDKGSEFERKVADRLIESLHSHSPAVRANCMDLLAEFIAKYSHIFEWIQRALVDDSDWRVREVAYEILDDEGRLPPGYKRPFSQWLRLWLTGGNATRRIRYNC